MHWPKPSPIWRISIYVLNNVIKCHIELCINCLLLLVICVHTLRYSFWFLIVFLYSGLTTFTDGRTAGSCWRTTPWVTTNPRTSANTAVAAPCASARRWSQWVSRGRILPEQSQNQIDGVHCKRMLEMVQIGDCHVGSCRTVVERKFMGYMMLF